jgi:hypothetical protein
MIVMTMAITASVNASSRPFVTAKASHTRSSATEIDSDQDDFVPVPPERWIVAGFSRRVADRQAARLATV